jgi:hypothetical protein
MESVQQNNAKDWQELAKHPKLERLRDDNDLFKKKFVIGA